MAGFGYQILGFGSGGEAAVEYSIDILLVAGGGGGGKGKAAGGGGVGMRILTGQTFFFKRNLNCNCRGWW